MDTRRSEHVRTQNPQSTYLGFISRHLNFTSNVLGKTYWSSRITTTAPLWASGPRGQWARTWERWGGLWCGRGQRKPSTPAGSGRTPDAARGVCRPALSVPLPEFCPAGGPWGHHSHPLCRVRLCVPRTSWPRTARTTAPCAD